MHWSTVLGSKDSHGKPYTVSQRTPEGRIGVSPEALHDRKRFVVLDSTGAEVSRHARRSEAYASVMPGMDPDEGYDNAETTAFVVSVGVSQHHRFDGQPVANIEQVLRTGGTTFTVYDPDILDALAEQARAAAVMIRSLREG